MGTKNLKLGIVAEPTILGGNVTVTVTGGDQTQTFSLAKSGNITIPTSLEDAQYVEIPVTADDYLYKSNFTFVIISAFEIINIFALSSALYIGTPSCSNILHTMLLPDPILPVIPIFCIFNSTKI